MYVKGQAASRWQALDNKRSRHLTRCRLCAKLTIPSLLPDIDADDNSDLPIPYQGLGARAVNNLSAKLLLTLFPPNTTFFRLDPDPGVIAELKEADPENNKDIKQKIEKQLRQLEATSIQDFEQNALRVKLFEAIRNLIVTGNALLELQDDGGVRVHRLDRYVVARDPQGKVREIIIEERIYQEDIPSEIKQQIHYTEPPAAPSSADEPEINLYTRAYYADDQWIVNQEVGGVELPDSEATYPDDKFPYLVLTWTRLDRNHYGQGHVEDNLGDLNGFDMLSQALLEGSAAAAFLLFLLHPNSQTDLKDIKMAKNGDIIVGREEDISVLKVDKVHDFRTAYEQANQLAQSIKKTFLLTESVQRSAERVTAEEIRYMAQELESALGGIYSVLGAELQRPFATKLLDNQRKRGKLPAIPPEIDTTIITGFDALGRGHDLNKLREFRDEVAAMTQASGKAEDLSLYIGLSNFFMRVATSLGLDTDGLVPPEEEIAQLKQQQEMYTKMMEMMNNPAVQEAMMGGGQQQQQPGGM